MTPACPMCKAPRVPKNLYAIKPCPFCGCEPKVRKGIQFDALVPPGYAVCCENPHCLAKPSVELSLCFNTAIQRWNRRVGIDCFG